MFNKEEAKKLRQDFWIEFGEIYPRKWLLHYTKVKEVSLKFTFNNKMAQVALVADSDDALIQEYYYEKLWSLEKILKTEYFPNIVMAPDFYDEYRKHSSRVYIQLDNVNIYNRNCWEQVQDFLYDNMTQMELFFYEYEDFIMG